MALTFLDAVDFTKIPALQFVVPVVAADPAGYEAGFIYNSTSKEVKYHNGTAWVVLGPAGAGGPPTGAAGGDLTGSYPNPQIAAGVIVDADVAAVNKDGAVATPSLRTLGFGAQQALAGTSRLDQIAAPTSSVNFNLQKLANVLDPVASSDGATKGYVDSLAQGLSPKDSVKAATTANIANIASGAPNTLDGVALAYLDRVLVKDQTTQTQNGIYFVQTAGTGSNGGWLRATDMDVWAEVPSASVWVEQGTANADTAWVCTADQGGAFGTTAITWVLFSVAGTTQAGAGLTKTGQTIDFVGDTNLSVAADLVSVVSAPKWTTPRSISLTGDVTGSAATVDGSANVSIATTVVNAGKRFAQDVAAGTAVIITHNLNSRDLQVQVYRTTTPWDVIQCGVEMTSVNTLTLRFATAVAANAYRVVITG